MRRIRLPSAVTAIVACALSTLLLAGCGGGEPSADIYTIEKGERSTEIEGEGPPLSGATARITAPADSAVVDSAGVDITIEASNFETGIQTETVRADEIANSPNGQHFHVIVDNGPYMANYEAGTPFSIGELAPGPHTVVTFPSRSYHESVKSDSAADVVNFYVGEATGEFMMTPGEPTIVYSRPKGTYSGADAERIMFDFYLLNATLGPDRYTARYQLREAGESDVMTSITLDEWTPAFIDGLDAGTYEVQLQLLDAEGNVVPGPFNDTTREIQVEP
jgi:hypothetical protein